ncbi:MAG: glycosyltransferase family 1 protein [Bacilli bacterium]
MEDRVIRVLQIVPNMRSAGIENFIMNFYKTINRDEVQFDFLVHSNQEQEFDSEITKLGGKIYRLTYKDDKNILKYIKDLNNFFKNHSEYDIVHGEMQSMMPLYLSIAKKNGVSIRIAHAHNSSYEKTLKGFILHLFSRFSKYPANVFWACSNSAGKYLFGNKKYEIIYNAIDIEKFKYNEDIREKLRKEMNLENKMVIGNVARFELQKNHEFLIDVFEKIVQKNDNAILLLIGDGYLKEKIKNIVIQRGLSKYVIFTGVRKNVNELYQAMDLFLLPSLYEGLPLVGVEAQISGLNCFFSTSITKEIEVSEKVKFLSLQSSSCEWADIILQNQENCRICNVNDSYNLQIESKKLIKKYKNLLNKNGGDHK